jgi:multiple sugar transport system permease protein
MLFAPYVTTLVATSVVWRYLLDVRFGLIDRLLRGIGLPAIDWLGNPHASIPAITLFIVWKIFGYNMLVFSAALATVPHELDEAARLDGAGPGIRLRHVTLPAIAPSLFLAGLVSLTGFFQIFSEPYVMTQGGPAQSTWTVLYFMVDEGFRWWNLGYASAVAVLLFAATVAVTGLQFVIARRRGWA